MSDAMELLKAAATSGYVTGGDAVDKFVNRVNEQKALIKKIAAGEKISQRSLWFKKDAEGYVVRIGRNAFEVAGSKLFRAADLDGVTAVLDAAMEIIKGDDKLRAMITKHSVDKSAQLKAGRKPKKK